MEKFSQIKYERPDMEELKLQSDRITAKLRNAKSYAEMREAFFENEKQYSKFSTAYVVAHVRNTLDTRDEYYDGEMSFFNQELPKLIPYTKKFTEAMLESPFRADFTAEFGEHYYKIHDNEVRLQDERLIAPKIEANGLTQRYQKLAASCKAEFRGEECNFYGLLKHMESMDRAERREAFRTWAGLYTKIAPELDEIYTALVKNRCGQAATLGFSSYIDMAYLMRQRYDYTPEDVASFRKTVAEVIVPLCAELRQEQAKRIGVEKLKYYDETFMFPDGNADPIGTVEELIAAAGRMYSELSPETGEFFEFMRKYELFDLKTRPGKHLGGYCTELEEYKAPFIFSNFNGTSADAEVLTHEAGHAFAGYTASRLQPISDYYGSTSEINEIHSMTMEHLTYPWMESFFGAGADKFRYSHLVNAVLVIPYLVSVDEFQHRVFENPEMTPDERRAAWKRIEEIYLPWRDYDGEEYMEQGGFWMQKQHIFLYPFYYIDYALAQICAFRLYTKYLADPAEGWNSYLKLCKAGGSRGYFDLLKLAGLETPFQRDTVEKTIAVIREEIKKMGEKL